MNLPLRRLRVLVTIAWSNQSASCGGDGAAIGGRGDAAVGDGSGDAGLIECPLDEETLEFGRAGFFTQPDTIERATSCVMGSVYRYIRWSQSPNSGLFSFWCQSIPACDPSSAFTAVREATADPEVAAALVHVPPAVFGLDRRSVDNGMYAVRTKIDCFKKPGMSSRGFDLGEPCQEGTLDCHPIPPAIARFVEQLQEMERQQRRLANCGGHLP